MDPSCPARRSHRGCHFLFRRVCFENDKTRNKKDTPLSPSHRRIRMMFAVTGYFARFGVSVASIPPRTRRAADVPFSLWGPVFSHACRLSLSFAALSLGNRCEVFSSGSESYIFRSRRCGARRGRGGNMASDVCGKVQRFTRANNGNATRSFDCFKPLSGNVGIRGNYRCVLLWNREFGIWILPLR